MAPGLLNILIASMQQYLSIYYIVFVHMYAFYLHLLFKASGAYVGVCPVHNHRVYRFVQACTPGNYLMKQSI